MDTIVKINTRTKAARLFLEFVKTLPFAKVEDRSHYNPEMIKKIKEAEKEKGREMKNATELWESIG